MRKLMKHRVGYKLDGAPVEGIGTGSRSFLCVVFCKENEVEFDSGLQETGSACGEKRKCEDFIFILYF